MQLSCELYIRSPQKRTDYKMAIISKIRKQSTILLIAIGGAMVLFVLGDLLSSNTLFMLSSQNELGEINGTKIEYKDFEIRYQKAAQMQFREKAPDASQQVQLREQVWAELIRENVYAEQFSKLGLKVSDEEVFNVIKNEPFNPIVRSYFTNPQTGQVFEQFANPDGSLNTTAITGYFQQVLNADPNEDPNVMNARLSYQMFKSGLFESITDSKYFNLLAKGMYISGEDLQTEINNTAKIASISFVSKLYSAEGDESFQPTEDELLKYYNQHKNEAQFKQTEDLVSLEYVSFEINPTAEDERQLFEELRGLIEEFKISNDDTVFISENGDRPFNFMWTSGGDFPENVDSALLNAEISSIIGPVRNENEFQLIKITDSKMGSDSVRARHILLSIENGDTAATLAKVDSLKQVILKNKNFEEMASLFSVDQGSAANGGDLDWFTEGRMVPQFNDACFNGKAGDMPIVTTQFGVHLIEIQEKTPEKRKVNLAIVSRLIEPSEETYQSIYNTASSFQINSREGDKFAENANEYGLMQAPSVRKEDQTVMGMKNSREIVRWAFKAKPGEVSQVYDLGESYVVARLVEVRVKGILPLDMVKEQVTNAVINKKKAEKFKSEMEGVTDLNALAQKTGTTVQNANNINFSGFSIPSIGTEPELQGIIFSLQAGQTSKPIEGKRGVYVVRVENFSEQAADAFEIREQLVRNRDSKIGSSFPGMGSSPTEAYKTLREMADIQDNRASFY